MTVENKSIEALTKGLALLNEKLDLQEKAKEADGVSLGNIVKGGAQVISRSGNSDEARSLKAFGCSDIKSLIQVNTADPKFARVPDELKQTVIELKKSIDIARFTAQMFHGAPRDDIRGSENDRASKVDLYESYFGKSVLEPMVKSFLSTGVGIGKETVQTLISASFVDEYQLDRVIEQSMQSFPMPSATYSHPIISGTTKARQIAENTAITDKNFTTSSLTFMAHKLGEYYVIPSELDEDSIIPFLELGRREVVEAQKRAVESAIINGDADGTHIDSDTQALPADVAEKTWNGLRRAALSNSANGGTVDFLNGPATANLLGKMRSGMGKFGTTPRDLLWIFGPGNSIQLQNIDQVRTLEQYGPQATIITGELEKFGGIPIVVSEYMRNNLNATGVYDGVTTNRSGILLVNARRWWIGRRRPITLAVQRDLPMQDRWLLASYQRLDFQGMPQNANETSVVYGYNVGQ